MKILVVGATGFLGRAVVYSLLGRRHEVTGTSLGPSRYTKLDVTDLHQCTSLLDAGSFHAIVNLAGKGMTAGTASADEMLKVNAIAPATLADALTRLRVSAPFLVHVASSTEPRESGASESDYSSTKALGSIAVRHTLEEAGLPFVIARVHNTYGPEQPDGRFLMSVIRDLQQGRPVFVRYPDRLRDFCYIHDVADNLSNLVEDTARSGRTLEIGTGVGTTLLDAAKMAAKRLNVDQGMVSAKYPAMPDQHPMEVADPTSRAFVSCKTSISSGIDLTIRSLT